MDSRRRIAWELGQLASIKIDITEIQGTHFQGWNALVIWQFTPVCWENWWHTVALTQLGFFLDFISAEYLLCALYTTRIVSESNATK